MAWTTPRNWIAAETVTAALMNTHVRDNLNELRTGGLALASGAAGDILYLSSAAQMARIAGAATGAALISGGTGSAPAWSRTPPLDGIQFAATQVASIDANCLDDFEKGAWNSMVIGGAGGTSGQTYNTQIGRYIKIGSLIHVQGYSILSAKGTITGGVQIQSLPFPAFLSSNTYCTLRVEFYSMATKWVSLQAEVQPNTTTANIVAAGSDNGAGLGTAVVSLVGIVTGDIGNATQMVVSGTYLATN